MTTLIEQRSLNRNLTFAYRGIYTTRNQEVKTVQKASKKGLAKNKTLSFTNADKYMGHTSKNCVALDVMSVTVGSTISNKQSQKQTCKFATVNTIYLTERF